MEISPEEWAYGWKKSKERTSNSPSIYHFGMGKAGVDSQMITELEAIMASIPSMGGFAPSAYQQAADACIEKRKVTTKPKK